MPKRAENNSQKKVFLVDIPDALRSFIPLNYLNDSIEVSQVRYYPDDILGGSENTDMATKELYKQCSEEAKLVITSKLHCAQPCIAMGIPVIIARETMSPRFELVNSISKVYLPSDYKNINWTPQIIDILELKTKIELVIENRIREKAMFFQTIPWLEKYWGGSFFDPSISAEHILLQNVEKSGAKQWVLWGGTGFMADWIYKTISKGNSCVKLCAVIDQLKKMEAFGQITMKAEDYHDWDNKYVVISTATGSEYAEKYLLSLGLKKKKDFFSVTMLP